MAIKIVTAKQQMRAAQSFPFFSSIAVLIPVLIPIWIAASIFVYAAAACHPNPKVCEYIKYSGYRFYGYVGALVAVLNFSSHLAKMAGGVYQLAAIIWVLGILVVVPLGVRDVLRARNEPWQDAEIECDDY